MKKVLLMSLCVVQIAGLYLLRSHGAFQRFIPVQNFEYKNPKNSNLQDVLKILEENNAATKNKAGWTCNDYSESFVQRLVQQGMSARKLFAVRQIGNQRETHTIVEVFADGRWMVVDPTFGVSYKNREGWLSATQVSRLLMQQIEPNIQVVQQIQNPHAFFQNYPVSWKSLYTNILQFNPGFWWAKWAFPLRYWWGPAFYYVGFFGGQNSYLSLLNLFYFFFICMLPLTLGLALIWPFVIKCLSARIKV